MKKVSYDISLLLGYSSLTNINADVGTMHSVGLPLHVYPLYENGLRAYRKQSLRENMKESAKLYAEFSKVAEKNPLSWNFGKPAETEQSLSTVTGKNRMICYPCMLQIVCGI